MLVGKLSLGFLTGLESNKTAQLQRLAKILKFCMWQCSYHTFKKVNNKGANKTPRKRRLVFAYNKVRVSRVDSHTLYITTNSLTRGIMPAV